MVRDSVSGKDDVAALKAGSQVKQESGDDVRAGHRDSSIQHPTNATLLTLLYLRYTQKELETSVMPKSLFVVC